MKPQEEQVVISRVRIPETDLRIEERRASPPPPVAAAMPAVLPKTASWWLVVLLVGLLCTGAAGLLQAHSRQIALASLPRNVDANVVDTEPRQ